MREGPQVLAGVPARAFSYCNETSAKDVKGCQRKAQML